MGRKDCKAIALSLLCLVMMAACKKDKPQPKDHTPVVDTAVKNVYVACEGNFGSGNAALTLYRPSADSVYEDVYKSANGQGLGDVLQSIQLIGDKFFLCINNSDQVLVIDRNTWKLVGSIPVSKPRYIVALNETKAYVSSLYTDQVTVIDPQSMQITGNITMPGHNAEGMLLYQKMVYVSLWDTSINKLYAIDSTDNVVSVQTLPGRAPQDALLDKDKKLWVLAGNPTKGKTATLTRIDPLNGQVLKSFTFPENADPLRPVFNPAKDTLYFIEVNYNGNTEHNGIYRMPINSVALPQQPFISANQFQYYWGLGIDPTSGYIYVGDPKGFTQKGTVYIYTQDGTEVSHFNTGVGPGHFYFDR